jgi:cysteine-rich repeat protein
VLGAAVAVLGLAGQVSAHGARLPFDKWGGFSPGAVLCQRVIGRAAAQCAASAWAARRACSSARLAGQTCDEAATDTAVEMARIKALNAIDNYCSERQAIELQYLGSFDLQADVSNFCRAWETAADSAVYGLVAPSGASAPQRACVEATADAADGVMQFIFRSRRQCMDRVAASALQAPNRTALLDGAVQRIDEARAALAGRLEGRCGATGFAALYGRPAVVFIDGLAARADCIGAQFYIQQAVLCPAAVCGNGIVELPDEDCDDGNTTDGDACPANCKQQ